MIIKRSAKRVYLKSFLTWIIITAVLLFITPFIGPFALPAIALETILLLLYSLAMKYYYATQNITVSENGVELTKGIFNVKKVIIPFEKIENVRMQQSLFERLLNETTLVIDSSGTSSLEIVLPDVSVEEANELVNLYHSNIKSK